MKKQATTRRVRAAAKNETVKIPMTHAKGTTKAVGVAADDDNRKGNALKVKHIRRPPKK